MGECEVRGGEMSSHSSHWSGPGGWLYRLETTDSTAKISSNFQQIFSFHLKSAGTFEAPAEFLSMSPSSCLWQKMDANEMTK